MYYSALIGKPTDHSVSHIMYEELACLAKILDSYRHLKMNVEKEELEQSLRAFVQLGFIGINVTLPYKLDVIPLVDSLDRSALDVGAVNTILFNNDKLIGFNTDWYGVYKPVKKLIGNVDVETIAIFGSGGAARAAIFAAKKLSAKKIIVLYRSDPLYDSMTKDLRNVVHGSKIELVDYSHVEDCVKNAQIIINATSTGMLNKTTKSPFDLSNLDGIDLSNKVFLDAVFNPVDTPMIDYFKSRGATTIDGLWMMIYQGIKALGIWLNKNFEFDEEQLISIHNLLKQEVKHV